MCEQCLADAVVLVELVPSKLALIQAKKDGHMMKAGEYGLVTCNDPFTVFSTKPYADPMVGMTDEEIDAIEDRGPYDQWVNDATAFEKQVLENLTSIEYARELIEATASIGYDREEWGRFSFWLFDYLGRVLEPLEGDQQG